MNLESIFFLFFFLNHFISIFFKEGAERKWRFGLGSIFMAHLPTKRNEKKMRTKNIPVRNRTAFDPRVPFGLLPKVQNRNPFSLSLSLSLWFGLVWFVLGSFVGFASADWSASGDQSGSRFRDRAKLFELDLTLSCAALSFPS